jgi:uncharacterized protein YjbI with pentapeptide repeats
MNESELKTEEKHEKRRFDLELLKKGLRCDLDQYDMLKRCSKEKDMTEWNEWRENNPKADIRLEGAQLSGCYLAKVHLLSERLTDEARNELNFQGEVYLKGSNLAGANLTGAQLKHAHLDGVCLRGADLHWAHLERADLIGTNLESANLLDAHLEGAYFEASCLQGAVFHIAVMSAATRFSNCAIDRHTDFPGVSLDGVRMDFGTKQLLEYSIRRKNWEEWYTENAFLKWPVWLFWLISDYGLRTWRIIVWFLGLALFFAAIYSNLNYWYPPGIVSNFEVEPHLPMWHYFLLLLIRPIYLSIVTMTIGFGNMDANAQSVLGHILVGLQVILGYVLLAALVTRFAVLFTAGGPAGKLADDKKNKIRNSKHEIRNKLK